MANLDEYIAELPEDMRRYLLSFVLGTRFVSKTFPTERGLHLRAARRGLARVAYKTTEGKVLKLTELGRDVQRTLKEIRAAQRAMEGVE